MFKDLTISGSRAGKADVGFKESRAPTRRSTEEFLYPPMTPTTSTSNEVKSHLLAQPPPQPHPYQTYTPEFYDHHLAAPPPPASSRAQLYPGLHHSAVSSTSSTNIGPDKSQPKSQPTTIQQTYFVHHHHHHHHHPSNSSRDAMRRSPRLTQAAPAQNDSILRKLRPLLLMLLFLPIPPLLSVVYILIGHSLLRSTLSTSPSADPWSPSLLSSANAAAIGGVILSLPIFMTLFLLLYSFSRITSSLDTRQAQDDFFEDDDDQISRASRMTSCAVYATCAAVLLGIGGAAAPLGVICLGDDGRSDILSSGRAAEAGILGGAVILGGVFIVVAIAVLGWLIWKTPETSVSDGGKD